KKTQRTADAMIDLPPQAWARLSDRATRPLHPPTEMDDREVSGDISATALHRVFKYDWDHGGRLYGGWWINLPKSERAHLTFNGQDSIELDYAQLHPTMLFARVGKRLDFDPYAIEGLVSPEIRALGKRTFNRLINKSSPAKTRPKLLPTQQDLAALPPGMSFATYLSAFTDRLSSISDFFGSLEG
ncbi:hypothetical protein LTR94_026075, partial [Friedmanniomyces endolithicus]